MRKPLGAVLVGGRGRRMGRDKATMRWQGTSLAARAADLLAPHCDRVVLIGRGGPLGEGDPPSLADLRPDQGPLGGLETALETAAGADVLLLACDLLDVDDELLGRLADRSGDFGAAAPEARLAAAGGRIQPLCGLYSAGCAETVRLHLDRGERAMRALVDALRVTTIEAGERLLNVNTPEDWRRWRSRVGAVGERE